MFDDQETSAIQAAVGGDDPYAWAQLMAALARCAPTDLDADAIFDVVRSATSPGAPREVNALRSLDAAGALVRAQLAFNDRSAEEFETRFASARELLATQVTQAGFDASDPAAKARSLRQITTTPKGCALVALVPLLMVGIIGAAVYFSIREVSDTVNSSIPDVEQLIENAGSFPTTPEMGLPFHRPGLGEFELWRAVVDPSETCTYGVAITGTDAVIEQESIVNPSRPQSVVARVRGGESLYAQGCEFTLAVASPLAEGNRNGDLVVGIDVDPGEATLTAAGEVCTAILRRYTDGGAKTEAETSTSGGQSATMTLEERDGEPAVLHVVGCAVEAGG